jgi:hypothetical protein
VSSRTEQAARAAMHAAVDDLGPPRLDLDAVRLGARRRRVRMAAGVIAVVALVVAGGITADRLLRVSPSPVTGGLSSSTASPGTPQPTSSEGAGPNVATAGVRAFYAAYGAALSRGPGAVDSLLRAYMASWYLPILEVSPVAGAPSVDCGAGLNGLRYEQAGVVGGQQVVVAQWATSAQTLYIVVTAEPDSGKITGITCAATGSAVTNAGARNAASSLFLRYLHARHGGVSEDNALQALMVGGPETGSPYLQQLREAISRGLSYDPVLCSAASVPNVVVSPATVVADGTAALVVVTPKGGGRPFVASVVLGAKGWTVADIACQQS